MSDRRKFSINVQKQDANTVFLLKLDDDSKDLISGKDVKSGSVNGKTSKWNSLTTTKAKFGKCGYTGSYSPSYDISHLNLGNKWTIDFWITIYSQPSSDYSAIFSTSQSEEGFIFRYYGTKYGYVLHVGNLWEGDNSGWVKRSISTTSPTHFAITRNGITYKLYENGVSRATVESSIDIKLDQLTFSNIGWPGGNKSANTAMYIDEFRISNVVRWDSNFTPPTEPY